MIDAQSIMTESSHPPGHPQLARPGTRCKCSDGVDRWLIAFQHDEGLSPILTTVPPLPAGVKVLEMEVNGEKHDYEKGDSDSN